MRYGLSTKTRRSLSKRSVAVEQSASRMSSSTATCKNLKRQTTQLPQEELNEENCLARPMLVRTCRKAGRKVAAMACGQWIQQACSQQIGLPCLRSVRGGALAISNLRYAFFVAGLLGS